MKYTLFIHYIGTMAIRLQISMFKFACTHFVMLLHSFTFYVLNLWIFHTHLFRRLNKSHQREEEG